MAKNSRKRIKNINKPLEDENEIKSFIIITIILVIVIALTYTVTELVRKKEVEEEPKQEINYDLLTVGTIFTAPTDNYYVLVYSKEADDASEYQQLFDSYKDGGDPDHKKIYYIDLNNKLNEPYSKVNHNNESNKKAKKISELSFGDITLLEIKDKSIVKYVEKYDEIEKLLK